jgi:hypothetical protein
MRSGAGPKLLASRRPPPSGPSPGQVAVPVFSTRDPCLVPKGKPRRWAAPYFMAFPVQTRCEVSSKPRQLPRSHPSRLLQPLADASECL